MEQMKSLLEDVQVARMTNFEVLFTECSAMAVKIQSWDKYLKIKDNGFAGNTALLKQFKSMLNDICTVEERLGWVSETLKEVQDTLAEINVT